MVLGYFIINIHMQLRRREAGHNSSNFLKPRREFTEKHIPAQLKQRCTVGQLQYIHARAGSTKGIDARKERRKGLRWH